MLQEIVEQLQISESHSPPTIAESQVRRWMSSDDSEVLGATYELLTDAKHTRRIVPALPFDDVFAFILRYFDFCLRNSPDGEWVHDRYSAGHEFVSFFVALWDEGNERKYFEAMKSLLRDLYTKGTSELKGCIELAIIEHLFERQDIREFFNDWRDDPQLRPAYERGMLWVKHGGRSPLTEPRSR